MAILSEVTLKSAQRISMFFILVLPLLKNSRLTEVLCLDLAGPFVSLSCFFRPLWTPSPSRENGRSLQTIEFRDIRPHAFEAFSMHKPELVRRIGIIRIEARYYNLDTAYFTR